MSFITKPRPVGSVIVHTDGAAYVILDGVIGHHVTAVLANMNDQPEWGAPVVALPWPLDGSTQPRAAKLPVVVTLHHDGGKDVEVHNATDEQIAYVMTKIDPDGEWALARIVASRKAWPGQPWCIPADWRPNITVESVRKLIKEAP